jgi:DNA-binding PadR family transcriptional regulator
MSHAPVPMTTPDFVVLGMISLGAQTGYAIKKRVATSIRFFWTISEAQIYPSLERLERAGMVAGRLAPSGRRRRREFELTPAGQEALHDWLVAPEPMPFELRDVGLVRLFFADALSPDEGRAVLGAVRRRSEARIAALSAIRPTASAASEAKGDHPLLTLRMGIAFHKAIIEVCEAFERETTAD